MKSKYFTSKLLFITNTYYKIVTFRKHQHILLDIQIPFELILRMLTSFVEELFQNSIKKILKRKRTLEHDKL